MGEETDLQDWFGSDHSYPGREEVLTLRSAGELLTVLYSERISVADDDEGEIDEEADLIESWTPRFDRR